MDQQILKSVEWVFVFVLVNTCLLFVALAMGVTILTAGFHARAILLEALGNIKSLLGTAVQYLEMTKQMSRSAHVNQQSAVRTREELPEAVAEKVAEKIKGDSKGDSGAHQWPPDVSDSGVIR